MHEEQLKGIKYKPMCKLRALCGFFYLRDNR
jgi:hypothetical protein